MYQNKYQLSDTQVKTIKAVLNIFETGSIGGNYGAVAVLKDGAGISYGKVQATDKANSLDKIVIEYINRNGKYAAQLNPYLEQLADPKLPLTNNEEFKNLLRKAGADPIMRQTQDDVFDRNYFIPALDKWSELQLTSALSALVVYDSYIQGAFSKVRSLFKEVPPIKGGDEKLWVSTYVTARNSWLISCGGDVRRSAYRTNELLKMIKSNNWNLLLPMVVRTIKIEEKSLC